MHEFNVMAELNNALNTIQTVILLLMLLTVIAFDKENPLT